MNKKDEPMAKVIYKYKKIILVFLQVMVVLPLMLISTCKPDLKKKNNTEKTVIAENNIFTDEVLQTIYTYQDQRNSAALAKYFTNEYAEYRKQAIMAFASVQDSMYIDKIAVLLTDKDEEVRNACAYTLGQIRNSSAEKFLLDAYANENSFQVQKTMLEAIGKCGSEKGLVFLCNLDFPVKETELLTGQSWGFSRFGMRGIVSDKATSKVLSLLLTKDMNEHVRHYASYYLSRSRKLDLTPFTDEIVKAYKMEGYIYTKLNLVLAMGKSKNTEIIPVIASILKEDNDYRIKVNAITALENLDYQQGSAIVFENLNNANANISIRASEYFLNKGIEKDAEKYFDYSKKITNWRARATMLGAALKFSRDKEIISQSIKSGFDAAGNVYEKAWLLKALAGNIMEYKFVENQLFSENQPIVKSSAIEALAEMRKSKEFPLVSKASISKGGDDLEIYFSQIFKRAIETHDVALMSVSANLIADTTLRMRKNLEKQNSYFLTQALNACQLPRDVDAYLELKKAIAYIDGKKFEDESFAEVMIKNNPIDWKLVVSIPVNQKVVIKTSKGNILLQLNVNEAPGGVSNFVKLIKNNFYLGSAFHRVVPNFVIQDGDPRGDGYGSPDFSIRSEFAPMYYEEGTVGMASAGKDTESAQFFITHFPTAHLDGRYSIIGSVVEGLEIVHLIEVGDKILSVELQ